MFLAILFIIVKTGSDPATPNVGLTKQPQRM